MVAAWIGRNAQRSGDSPIKGYKNIMYSLHFKEKRTAGHGD